VAVNDPAYHPLVRRVAEGLRRRCGVGEGDGVLVAVSAGADSVALLRAMAHLAGRRRWRLELRVAHVHHHLRGGDADADAAFVAGLAEALRLPCDVLDVRPASEPGNVEANGRRLRYAALAACAVGHGCGLVATAHHADDQLETLLMRMTRGTTVRGLRGIAWRRPIEPGGAVRLIRPMLRATHADAVDYLNRLAQPWREDASNADVSRTRARLRRDVLPVLRELRPGAALKAAELADHAREAVRRLPPAPPAPPDPPPPPGDR